jgi:hypothetical protein
MLSGAPSVHAQSLPIVRGTAQSSPCFSARRWNMRSLFPDVIPRLSSPHITYPVNPKSDVAGNQRGKTLEKTPSAALDDIKTPLGKDLVCVEREKHPYALFEHDKLVQDGTQLRGQSARDNGGELGWCLCHRWGPKVDENRDNESCKVECKEDVVMTRCQHKQEVQEMVGHLVLCEKATGHPPT